MRLLRLSAALVLVVLGILWWKHPHPSSPRTASSSARFDVPSNTARSRGSDDAAERNHASDAAVSRRDALARLAYARAWDDELPPALAAFRAWTERYSRASAAMRSDLEAEGAALARARRPMLRDLIVTDPQRALAVTVPMAVRQMLPAAVLAELEQRIAGKGEFALVARTPAPETRDAGPSLRRIAVLGGATYTAYTYGRREAQTFKDGASLHGIAIGRKLALHESPLRALDPGEVPGAIANESCPVSDLPVTPPAATAGVNTGALNFAEVNGEILELCDTTPEMLVTLAERLETTENNTGPRGTVTPPRAAEQATPWTIGTKQVLVIRVDFSDVPGEPVSLQGALNLMDTGVRPLFEDMSYGQTSIVATVSNTVYRLPQTASSYALADNEGQLHTDARNLASAHYTMTDFDRIIVIFPNIGTSRIPGSLITFGGEGSVNGPNIWINGLNAFTTALVSHELGHTYGLLHANLWRVSDGNPLSPSGTTVEYGDPFDTMGSTSVTGVTRDARHHFNAWHKNRLGWLPDAAVTTVTTSGTYRIYRFDHKDARRDQPLALRIFRDGVRWYWVGLRQNFATGSPQSNGAYVMWGFNNRQQSQLLDLTTPGTSANDAALPLGVEFSDPAYGITIKPLMRGGGDPAQFLDVEVTIGSPPNVTTSWGREGALFFSGNTGAPTSPTPETNVPIGLSGVQAIAGGDQHVVALKFDGTVAAWGDHVNGQTTVPAGLSDVVAVAAGGDASGAVRRDGTVQLWGLGTSGVTTPPAGLTNVTKLAIGRNHAVALRSDGTVACWGANNAGQATPPAITDVVAITAGTDFSVALKRDGTVVSWGATGGRPPAGLTGVTAISACGVLQGGQFVVALKSDGTVVAWGANNAGQTNVPAGLRDVVSVAAGAFHSLALKSDGSVVAWGPGSGAMVPRELPPSRAVAASASGSFALTSSLVIASQPRDQTFAAGDTAALEVNARGAGTVSYQWRKDGVAIAGATNRTLNLPALAANAAGNYDAVVRDSFVTLTTAPARLTVAPVASEVSRIANLSIRTNAGTGAQTLIVGFVVGGSGTSGTKPLLVRGVGPTLAAFGVNDALGDPKVELYNASSVRLLENDNWSASDAATFTRVGAFALNPGSRDAALYNGGMSSGGFSAQLSGASSSTGIVLAEIYDVTPPPTFGAATPRLINVSARTFSGTGSNVLIAGFVIAGPTSKTVLIRAIGPTLTAFGVTGVLADPRLELYNSATTLIQQNDNWGGGAPLAAAFTSVGAFQLPADSRDASLLATLQPGSYTAQVNGVGGTTGVALVEIYEAP